MASSVLASSSFSSSSFQRLIPAYWPWQTVNVGPLTVSPMGLGTWAWGNKFLWGYDETMDQELQEVFNLAVNSGVNLFDTADSYGTGRLNGRSELLLGRFIRSFPGPERLRRKINIATKFAAYPWRITPGQLVLACKDSLRRLECEQLAIGQLHWSTANYAPLQEKVLWDGLAAMYNEGLVKAVGVSNYGPQQLERVHAYLEKRGVPLSSAQVQFSLISYGPEQTKLKALCDSLGVKLIAYSPLGLGMLTGKYSPTSVPTGPRPVTGIDYGDSEGSCSRFTISSSLGQSGFQELSLLSLILQPNSPFEWFDCEKLMNSLTLHGLEDSGAISSHSVLLEIDGALFRQVLPGLDPLTQTLTTISQRRRKTASQVAINWCICKGTIPIPGVKSLRQAEENLGALGWRLSNVEVLELESAAANISSGMIQNIFQTK